jgi:hypothetical protein
MRLLDCVPMLLALHTSVWALPQIAPGEDHLASFQLFYDELSPYGIWVDHPKYGYVWLFDGEYGFCPYATAGHWIFTEPGWMWLSDYRWGWAPFHYGRWDHESGYGWFWVPGVEWSPAWVSWRSSPGYYGWAPMRPGISISESSGLTGDEAAERWRFVRDRDVAGIDVSHRYVNRTHNGVIMANSKPIVNLRTDVSHAQIYCAGPDRGDVERATHSGVRSVLLWDTDEPRHHLNNGELQIFRPRVYTWNGRGANPVPLRVMRLNKVRPGPDRILNDRTRSADPPSREASPPKLPRERPVR